MPETLAKKFAVNVLTPDAFKSIPKGSGNLLSTFDLSTPKIDSTNVVCATQGGVTISYSNSMEDTLADIDNAPTNTKQGNEVTGTTASPPSRYRLPMMGSRSSRRAAVSRSSGI